MRFIFIISLLISFTALAQELISIGKTKRNSLILRSDSCDHLLKQYKSICSWKESLDRDFVSPKISKNDCRLNSKNENYIVVSSCLPKFVKSNHGKKLYSSGANCWGTAMSFKGISNTPRFVWQKEMQYLMESPLCRKLSIKEKKIPGDIINVFGPEYIFGPNKVNKGTDLWNTLYPERDDKARVKRGYSGFHHHLHSETYITDDLAFGKESPNKSDRFLFHKLNETYGRSRFADCQENQLLTPHMRELGNMEKDIRSQRCGYFSVAYRCKKLESFLEEEKLTDKESLVLEEIDELKKRQDFLFQLMSISNKKLSLSFIKETIYIADQVSNLSLLELRENLSLSKRLKLMFVLQFFTAEGLRKSLELADLVFATEEK